MSNIDIVYSEKNRLKQILLEIIKEEQNNHPELKNIEIKVISCANQMEYKSVSGKKIHQLRIDSRIKK